MNNRKYLDKDVLDNAQLGSLDNHGRRMTRSARGSSRHSAGAAGSRRQSPEAEDVVLVSVADDR